MTPLPLPALDGRTPLGFLAGLGVPQLVAAFTSYEPRLAWSRTDATGVLHDAHHDVDELVDDLATIVQSIPAAGVLPGMCVSFPPDGRSPDKLRLPQEQFAQYATQVADQDGAAGERWLSALVTDLSVNNNHHVNLFLFAAPSGGQSTRTMFEKPLGLVQKNPGLLREALVAWRRYPGVSGEYLDHRVLFDAADAPDGRSAERGVPGATWLALMSYPLMRTTAAGAEPLTTCWQDFGSSGGRRMVYPLWSDPLDPAAVGVLLSHPVLERAKPGPPPTPAELLSVFTVVHAQRRRVGKRKFAGVLTPTSDMPRPPARLGCPGPR